MDRHDRRDEQRGNQGAGDGLPAQQELHGRLSREKGQLLFEIDPRPLQAALDQARGKLAQAQGQLAQAGCQLSQAEAQVAQAASQLSQADAQVLQAEANQGKTQRDVNRTTARNRRRDSARSSTTPFRPTSRRRLRSPPRERESMRRRAAAGGHAQVKTARAVIVSAKAQVQAAQAEVRTAELNLGFTRIISPIDGIAGIAKAQVGDLVSPAGDALTTVSTSTPSRSISRSASRSISASPGAARRTAGSGEATARTGIRPRRRDDLPGERQVLRRRSAGGCEDGRDPARRNLLEPRQLLRPGQYGRVRAVTSVKEGALLVPQRAVTELQGSYQVAVVGADNKVGMRTVKVGERVGTMWIIEDGLKPGEGRRRGHAKIRPGAAVKPKPFN